MDERREKLRTEVLYALAFFDLFDYPLSLLEFKALAGLDFNLMDIAAFLADNACVSQKEGFYFLNGREEIIKTRQARFNYARRKIERARLFSRLISFWPFINLVAVSNSIGAFNLRDGSDIDLFVIAKPRRLFLARLVSAGLAKILSLRPTDKDKRDKICLSFFAASDSLDMRPFHLAGGDPYFHYWSFGLEPVYDSGGFYENFLAANTGAERTPALRSEKFSFLDRVDNWSGIWQLKFMPEKLRSRIGVSDGVIINDSVIRLFLTDRRREIRERHRESLNKLLTRC